MKTPAPEGLISLLSLGVSIVCRFPKAHPFLPETQSGLYLIEMILSSYSELESKERIWHEVLFQASVPNSCSFLQVSMVLCHSGAHIK